MLMRHVYQVQVSVSGSARLIGGLPGDKKRTMGVGNPNIRPNADIPFTVELAIRAALAIGKNWVLGQVVLGRVRLG